MVKISDGDEFGFWTVQDVQKTIPLNKKRHAECVCRCGKVGLVRIDNLISRLSESCGCKNQKTSKILPWFITEGLEHGIISPKEARAMVSEKTKAALKLSNLKERSSGGM